MRHNSNKCKLIGSLLCLAASHTHALEININAAPDFTNTLALDAFQRAADTWEGYFSDDITVNISASFKSFGTTPENLLTIGSTSSTFDAFDYDFIVNRLKLDADADDGILAYLPSSAQFSANSSAADTVITNAILINKANLKALGFTGVDVFFGSTSDGDISFNSDFNFDFDNSDGVSSGLIDFESVAIHEIGHLLGFTSIVDSFDQADGSAPPYIIDLFRFNADDVPLTNEEFTTTSRELTPGEAAVFTDTRTTISLSTGRVQGDGSQASHFKDNLGTGIMDPTLASGEFPAITENDLLAFDLIGYDRLVNPILVTAVPEPSSAALALIGALGFLGIRNRVS